MKRITLLSLITCLFLLACNSEKKTESTQENTKIDKDTTVKTSETNNAIDSTERLESAVKITPIFHGTLILEYNDVVIYIDPVKGKTQFEGQKPPTLILITDIHGDHFDETTLIEIIAPQTKIIAPLAVAELLPKMLRDRTSVLANFQIKDFVIGDTEVIIEGIPMYNLREEALKFHPKNRGNGYVLTLGEERVYISGDTEDIPEMRNLEAIDIAFVCMNLPYTMTVESAADAVLEFKPKKVYPYHFRGTEGFSDVKKFETIINEKNSAIEVIQDDWYKKSDEL